MKRAVYALIAAFALCAGFSAFLMTAPKATYPVAGNANDLNLAFQPHPGARLPLTATLVDEDGHGVALGDYFAKAPVILVLEYLRCTSLCGITLRHLVADTLNDVPLQPGRDYQLVAISIDPRDKADDAAKAQATYADLLRGHGGVGLHFLTGMQAAVRQIADAIGFPYQYDSLLDAYIHPAGFVIASPDGLISRYVEGVALTPAGFVAAIADAEQNKSQGLLTRLVLLCHVKGTPLGRFTVPVLAALMLANVAAGLTAFAIFTANRRWRYG
jgi:protein SCO1/2